MNALTDLFSINIYTLPSSVPIRSSIITGGTGLPCRANKLWNSSDSVSLPCSNNAAWNITDKKYNLVLHIGKV